MRDASSDRCRVSNAFVGLENAPQRSSEGENSAPAKRVSASGAAHDCERVSFYLTAIVAFSNLADL